ncbi:transporter substrate-binding domain-containing protein [Nocardioides sp.]|uniref:transporter substrate-binding domain-containing protein n=1 Tax=Nocardioides sp. TaxID=35761 RepID=UPI002F3E5FBA
MSVPSARVVRDLAPQGVLRASINLGNAVLAAGTPEDPSGVTVDLAREIAVRLGVEPRFICFDAARKSFEALQTGLADIGFLAIEPEREAELAFTAPYAVIEAVYVARDDGPVESPAHVDRHGIRVGVKRGSAYDLFLTRTLASAEVVRRDEGVEVFADEGLQVGAGIRLPVTSWVTSHPGHRVLEPAFMQIRQAVATTRDRDAAGIDFLRRTVRELIETGFVRTALAGSGQDPDLVAAPG